MNLNKKTKMIGTIIGIVLFAGLIVGITYAVIAWRSGNTNISGDSECFTINYTLSPTINNESVILFDESKIIQDNRIILKNGMALTGLSASMDSNCTTEGQLTVTLNINNLNKAFTNEGQSTGAFKFVVASYDTNTFSNVTFNSLVDHSFEIISSGIIVNDFPVTLIDEGLSTTNRGYLVIFYVDGDLAQNDAGETTFSATINGVATQTE